MDPLKKNVTTRLLETRIPSITLRVVPGTSSHAVTKGALHNHFIHQFNLAYFWKTQ